MRVVETGIGGRRNCTGSAGEGSSAADSGVVARAERRSAAAVARKIRGGGPWMTEVAADTGCYRHRCPIPMRTAASQRNAAIGYRLAMTEAADHLR